MGIYEFVWPHPAGEVIVTGTFDEWRGSVKLQRDSESGRLSVCVDVGSSEKILYKYIVNGNWTVNYDSKREYDNHGNENNVLYPEDLCTEENTEATEEVEETLSLLAPALDETLVAEEVDLDVTARPPTPPDLELNKESNSILDVPTASSEEETDTLNPVNEWLVEPAEEIPEPEPESDQIVNEPAEEIVNEPTEEIVNEPAEEAVKEPLEAPAPAAPIRPVEPENQPPVTNTLKVSPTMSPLTTPATTTHVYTASVPGATWLSQKTGNAPSMRSSTASSHSSHNEKRELFKERTPEKKREKRRSVILGRLLNLFK